MVILPLAAGSSLPARITWKAMRCVTCGPALVSHYLILDLLWRYSEKRILVFFNSDYEQACRATTVASARLQIGSGNLTGRGMFSRRRACTTKLGARKRTGFYFQCYRGTFRFIGACSNRPLYLARIVKNLSRLKLKDRFGSFICIVVVRCSCSIFRKHRMSMGALCL